MGTFGGTPFNPVDNLSINLNGSGQIQATGVYNNPIQQIKFFTNSTVTSGAGAPLRYILHHAI